MPVPTTTYRLQLRDDFGFRDAAAIVPYLHDLGVSHVYCSPVLQAVPGSAHGYDVVDHSRLSDDLGGDEGWAELAVACETHGLGIVIDIVPNHMAWPTPERLNPVFWDVLEHGRESPYSQWLDVDWDAQDGRLLLPVLGRPLGEAVTAGEVTIDPDAGVIRYFDHEFPMAPGSSSLVEQHYRLAHWRTGNDELNYRRFFDVTTLVAVRVERPEVFDATHRTLLSLPGPIDGWRIDHPDGLADPGGYLERLGVASPDHWVVVEKILGGEESLPPSWRCAGTTGYDALTMITAVMIDIPGNGPDADTDESADESIEAAKRLVVRQSLGAEVDRVVRELLSSPDARGVDLSPRSLREAVEEFLVAMPVYRAYPEDPDVAHRIVETARGAAKTATALTSQGESRRAREIDWVADHALASIRLMQTAGPVMAKGVEDTAFYRDPGVLALKEVGSDLHRNAGGRSVADWHEFCARLEAQWPATMTTLSTHDTKRSEDVRARLVALLELGEEWRAAVAGWNDRIVGPPGNRVRSFLWQHLVAAWPISQDRLQAYLEKAGREAKLQTTWTEPSSSFERAVAGLIAEIYANDELMTDVGDFVALLLRAPGLSNSLSQKLLQLTMPGVADIYQGCELESYALVDPDNRRPVDYERRRHSLAELDNPADPDKHVDPANLKLLVTATTARLRRHRPELVGAAYTPLEATGPGAEHAIAYRRGENVVCVATRLPVRLARRGGWGNAALALPGAGWRDLLTGRDVADVSLATVLDRLPVALLVR